MEHTHNSIFSICHSPQKSSVAQKVYKRALCPTSPSALTRCHCPGCGSQRLLRCRSHPAGRCPNSSSLLPPLAAVVAVAPSRGGFGSPRKVNGFARGSPTRGAVERSETERLYEGKPDREPLQRPFTQVLGNMAAPRGAGYLAEFHFLLDITFRIEHRKLCEVGLSCEVGTSQMTRTSQTLRSSNIIRIYIKYSEHRKMFHHSRTA